MKVLSDILVADFSQFLSGPSAGLRLADLGAEVIKIEQPVTGDICRQLYVSDVEVDGESSIFHAINRNKKSVVLNLKDAVDLATAKAIIIKADVMIHNFRPGTMEKFGLDYDEIKKINPGLIYAEISGYGCTGPWRDRPGQDLLVQAVSGLTHLSGNYNDGPTPMGVAVADLYAGAHLVQGILAGLYERHDSGVGIKISVSMFESMLDFQFEVLTCFYNDGHRLPVRSNDNSAHAFVGAPYGIYKTQDGFIAIAMTPIPLIGELLDCQELRFYNDPSEWFSKRDEIKSVLKQHLITQGSQFWLELLEKADVWCAEVLDYDSLTGHDGYKSLQMEQQVHSTSGTTLTATRCPIRIDGELLTSTRGAPAMGEHTRLVTEKFYSKQ